MVISVFIFLKLNSVVFHLVGKINLSYLIENIHLYLTKFFFNQSCTIISFTN